MKTREDFHKLIDEIKDERILNGYFGLIQQLSNNESGSLWDNLKPEEKEELLLSCKESFIPDNVLSHAEVKKQHQQWLGK